jgi:hypothetical protein
MQGQPKSIMFSLSTGEGGGEGYAQVLRDSACRIVAFHCLVACPVLLAAPLKSSHPSADTGCRVIPKPSQARKAHPSLSWSRPVWAAMIREKPRVDAPRELRSEWGLGEAHGLSFFVARRGCDVSFLRCSRFAAGSRGTILKQARHWRDEISDRSFEYEIGFACVSCRPFEVLEGRGTS